MWKPTEDLVEAVISIGKRKTQAEAIAEFKRITGKGKSTFYAAWNIVQERIPKPQKTNKTVWKEFHKELPKGKKFIKMWNNAYRDGIQQKIAKEFNISVPTVYRLTKKLGLKGLHDPEHPGQKKFLRRIKKMYLWEGKSTLWIAKVFRMCSQNINIKLKSMGIKMNPQHCVNPTWFKTRSGITPRQLLDKIKKMYVDEHLTAAQIARELKIDQGTVSTKLKGMGIPIVSRREFNEQIIVVPNLNIKGIYLETSEPFSVICQSAHTCIVERITAQNKGICQWCKKEFPKYISTGPRMQKSCSTQCKNKIKDYRRMMRGQKVSVPRIIEMEKVLKETWGKEFEKAIERILDVKPVITNGKKIQSLPMPLLRECEHNRSTQDIQMRVLR